MDSPFECQARCAQTDECDYYFQLRVGGDADEQRKLLPRVLPQDELRQPELQRGCSLRDPGRPAADLVRRVGFPRRELARRLRYVVWGRADLRTFAGKKYLATEPLQTGPKVCAQQGEAAPIFIAEVAEGSSYNKYMEIYNPSDVSVDLTEYAFPNENNAVAVPGVHQFWNT